MDSVPPKLTDRCLLGIDRVLRTLNGIPHGSARADPGQVPDAPPLTDPNRQKAGRLMRVNFSGEVAAQALYHGQELGARDPAIVLHLRRAAEEENDHLIWCRNRLKALETRPSLLNPLWYGGAFCIGVLSGALGDRVSLGFLDETEQQVVKHLGKHLQRLPEEDKASANVLHQMRLDEARHSRNARVAGSVRPPLAVRAAMRLTARIMTTTAYWI